MAYPTQLDLEFAAGGASRLVQITDWDNTTALDTARLDQAIEMADGEVNSYLKKFFEVPLAVPPAEVRGCSARIAIFKMAAARGMATDVEIKGHEMDMAWLKGIADGTVTLGVQPQPVKSSMRVDRVTPRPTSKEISRAKLNGFR